MKVGIITLWKSNDNYGQILQIWALQQVLKDMGCSPYVIKYNYIKNSCFWSKVVKILLIYPIVLKIISYEKGRKLKKAKEEMAWKNIQRQFDQFKSNNIIFSNINYNTLKDLQEQPPKADVYISGSDQVWSYLLDDKNNEAFYLNFGNKEIKRISYAASFGRSEYPSKLKNKLKENLSRYCSISVREKSGVDICEGVGLSAQHVLDPTLLCSATLYSSLIQNNYNEVSHPYLFVYYLNILSGDELPWEEIESYSKSHSLNIKITTSSGYTIGQEFYKDYEYLYPTIEKWLCFIQFSEAIITTSFHGVVFSIIFNKKFAYIPLKNKFSGGNNRVIELLDSLGLSHHIYIDNKSDISRILSYTDNWEEINDKIKAYSVRSKTFLNNALI